MPITTHDRPDPKYYMNIIQYDNGDWAADPLPLDDTIVYPAKGGYGAAGLVQPGLRTRTSQIVATLAALLIQKYAPNDLQRNALYTLTQHPTDANAKAMMDWIAAVNAYRDSQIAYVKTLNFNQIVAYIAPTGTPPWPAPPAGLTPHSARVGTATYTLQHS